MARDNRQFQDNLAVIIGCIVVVGAVSVAYYMNSGGNMGRDTEPDIQQMNLAPKSGGELPKGADTSTRKPSEIVESKSAASSFGEDSTSGQKPPSAEAKSGGTLPNEPPLAAQKPSGAPSATRPKAGAPPKPADLSMLPRLQLLDKEETQRDGSRFITGHVRNNSKEDCGYIEISFTLKDAQGNVIGSAFANSSNLRAGEVWKFDAAIFDDNAVSFYLSDLKGF